MGIKQKGFNIAIDGHSGVGKSSIGYQVAKRLNFTFIDSVVGQDATAKILSNARVKLVLEADFEMRLYRRVKQLNAEEFVAKVFSDLLKHDIDSFDLVLEAKKIATIINTSNLSIEQVIKANPQVDFSEPQEESSTPQIKELTVQELIVLKNWELANYIANKAYLQLIVKLEERHEFMNYLKEFYELQVTEYEKIEREVLPKNRSNKKLYTDAQVWRKDVLMKSKNATKFQASHLATKILESEIDQLNRESENNHHNQSSQSHETNHQIKIIDLPHKNKHEVIAEMNKWEHAVRNDTCGELINNFGYISNQNGYVRNLDDEVYFSDNDLRIDSDFSNSD
ncbi:hypothetical protein F8M41_007957 [Gigaspora margarita]|uniref:(d)CMP kinase n=1 Tax=Gigaspora margarita TaxID=4874 RepID=A0A8H4A405_GIGMA|nr:hypothetical protein F8M41_007957 [Gigaspora margarita]